LRLTKRKEIIMRKRTIAVSVLSLVLVAGTLQAQTSDFSILAGAYAANFNIGTQPASTSASAGAGIQLGYSHQLLGTRAGSLDLDVPLTVTMHHDEVIKQGMSVGTQTNVFFTPGMRYRIVPQARVSPFVVLGGGFGSFGIAEVYAGSGFGLSVKRTVSPVLGLGCGADFRITRLISFRGEVRDFVSRAGLGGVQGRHHPVFGVGFGFHFN
jgi:hypothetical protein